MTPEQADYLWERARLDGEEDNLRALFPDVDWDAAEARREAAGQARRAELADQPRSKITLDDVNRITLEIIGPDTVRRVFEESHLLGRLKR